MEKQTIMISFREEISVAENIKKCASARGLDLSNFLRQALRDTLRHEADEALARYNENR